MKGGTKREHKTVKEQVIKILRPLRSLCATVTDFDSSPLDRAGNFRRSAAVMPDTYLPNSANCERNN